MGVRCFAVAYSFFVPLPNEPNNKRYENRANSGREKTSGIGGEVMNVENNKALFLPC